MYSESLYLYFSYIGTKFCCYNCRAANDDRIRVFHPLPNHGVVVWGVGQYCGKEWRGFIPFTLACEYRYRSVDHFWFFIIFSSISKLVKAAFLSYL